MAPLHDVDELEVAIAAKRHSAAERRAILECIRANRVQRPDVVVMHASALVKSGQLNALGDEKWPVLEQLAHASLHLGMLKWTGYCLKLLRAQFPESGRVARIFAMYRESKGEFDDARKIYDEIIEDHPEQTWARKRYIASFRMEGKPLKAIEKAKEYLETYQLDKEAWQELAALYVEQAQLQKAQFCIEEVVLHDPRNAYALVSYGELAFSLGSDIELARKYFCLCLEVNDQNVRALWGLFMCNCAQAKRDQGSDKIMQLHKMCATRLRGFYVKQKTRSAKILLSVIDDEVQLAD